MLVQTYSYPSGINPLLCPLNNLKLDDIINGLASVKRFNGINRTNGKYDFSVLNHSLFVYSRIISEDNPLYALMHDATEAYMGDLVRGVKENCPDYTAIEKQLMARLCERFDISTEYSAKALKQADELAFQVEDELNRGYLVDPSHEKWYLAGSPSKEWFYRNFCYLKGF